MQILPAEIIKLKREGFELSAKDLRDFVDAYVRDEIPDYQMAALLMACFFKGLSSAETQSLVVALKDSGKSIAWLNHPRFLVDKHSTGGVGDKTSLVLAPIVAAAGLSVPMMSGRGLGHTGGTLDKLDSIPGFKHNISLEFFEKLVTEFGVGFIGQTDEICPADKRIYALRDVTATVESIPLICASILSKKLAEGAQGLVLDVKFGNGAFFKTAVEAENLARALLDVYKGFGKKGVALLTNMNQSLGFSAGNSLEVLECLDILHNRTRPNTLGVDLYQDTRELSLELSAQMLFLSEQFGDLTSCRKKAEQILVSGQAYEKFVQICKAQGGDLEKIGRAQFQLDILAKQSGFVAKIETEKLGYLNIHLGAGRRKISDVVDPTSGVEFLFKLGHAVKKGQTLMRLHGASLELLKTWAPEFQKTFVISEVAPVGERLVFKVIV